MREINSPEELEVFLKQHNHKKIRKSLGEYDDSIQIKLYIFNPYRYDMTVYKVPLVGLTKPIVSKYVRRLYSRLPVPEINSDEMKEWDSRVSSDKSM